MLMIEELAEMSTSLRSFTLPAAWILNTFFLLIGGAPLRLLRSFTGLILQRCQKAWALNWTTLQVISASGLLLLPFAVVHREQLSLVLGWTASLAARCFARTTRFRKHLRIYLLLAPCLLPLALPHPLSVLVTFVSGAVLPWLTLPAALAEFALPGLHPLIEIMANGFEASLRTIDQALPEPLTACAIPVSILFVYLIALTGCAEWASPPFSAVERERSRAGTLAMRIPPKTVLKSAMAAALLLWTAQVGREPTHHAPIFAIWNVGQGLWTTWITDDFCLHFDAGGEKAPWHKILASCRRKENLFSFSHWDEDHISFVRKAREALANGCLWHKPGGEGSARKQTLMAALPPCRSLQILVAHETLVHEILAAKPRPTTSHRRQKAMPNDMSRIFVINREILAPGDATSREEKNWSTDLRTQEIQLLVLGHHGSRTSTSLELLKNLPHVKMAVASARKARYGHPHAEVIAHLHADRVALLSTEDWGSIYWEEGKKKAPHEGRLFNNTKQD